MEKFEWLPTECAPRYFPIQIFKGDFLLENGGSIYIPDGKMVYNGWGNEGSVHLVGEDIKPIPNHLNITWFSFIEDKFYSGSFDLPSDKIKKLFKEGYTSPITRDKETYNNILVGLAPGGNVAVWVMGDQITREVCFMQAKEIEMKWESFLPNPDYPREKFVKLMLEEAYSTDELSLISKTGIPIDLWSKKYRTRYYWEPYIIGKARPKEISLKYYNGEREFIDYQSGVKNNVETKTIPNEIVLTWVNSIGSQYSSKVIFNEKEIFAAFRKLNEMNTSKDLKLRIEISDIDQSLKIYLSDDKYILDLINCEIEIYVN